MIARLFIFLWTLMLCRSAFAWSSAELVEEGAAAQAEGHIGEAQLHWRRARLLDPHAKTGPIEDPPPPTPLLAPSTLAWVFRGGALLGLGGLVLLATRGRRPLPLLVATTGAALTTVTAWELEQLGQQRSLAVVIQTAELRPSPARAAEARRTLEPGTAVTMGETHGSFVRVESPEGAGWVEANRLTPVVVHGT